MVSGRDRELRAFARALTSINECERLRRYVGDRRQAIEQAESKARGRKRRGRPPRNFGQADLMAIVRDLTRKRSVRWIARKLKVPHATLARFVVRERLREQIAEQHMHPAKGGKWQRRMRRKSLRAAGFDIEAMLRDAALAKVEKDRLHRMGIDIDSLLVNRSDDDEPVDPL